LAGAAAWPRIQSKLSAAVWFGRTYAKAIAEKLAAKAVTGDIRAAQELADRAEGKARQNVQIENIVLKQAFEHMSELELENLPIAIRVPRNFRLARLSLAPRRGLCWKRAKKQRSAFKSFISAALKGIHFRRQNSLAACASSISLEKAAQSARF
jgi:hypothetical protein